MNYFLNKSDLENRVDKFDTSLYIVTDSLRAEAYANYAGKVYGPFKYKEEVQIIPRFIRQNIRQYEL